MKIKNSKFKMITETKPLVSVIMPVYNALPYLSQAIDSILDQTYQNFEFIIIDDASQDGSYGLLQKYATKNKKIRLFRNSKNLGISESAKRAISKTKGGFIARMDADDIALPYRIERQVEYLLKNKKTVAIGGQCILINEKGDFIGNKRFPTEFKDIYKLIFEFIPLQQPTLMIAKRRLPENFEYYKDGMNTAEEVELFFKLFLYGKVENLKDPVLMYRFHGKNTSMKNIRETFFLTLLTRFRAVLLYKYRPTLKGILVTLLQLILILILPGRVNIFLYKVFRSLTTNQRLLKIDTLLAKQLSPEFLFSKSK